MSDTSARPKPASAYPMTRRQLVKTGAWAAPAVIVAVATPMAAASTPATEVTVRSLTLTSAANDKYTVTVNFTSNTSNTLWVTLSASGNPDTKTRSIEGTATSALFSNGGGLGDLRISLPNRPTTLTATFRVGSATGAVVGSGSVNVV